MSHASCIVALSPKNIADAGSVEAAVAYQMEPFDEGVEWFADGSRWDWWIIGGRFTGKFTYCDLVADAANYEPCRYCNATGTRAGSPADWTRQPDKAGHAVIGNGCNVCRGTGWELKFYSDWRDVGNVAKRGDLTNESIVAFAFLKDREWHEQGRLGWFGVNVATECEIKAKVSGTEFIGRCVHEANGAKIIDWTGPEDSNEKWDQLYFARFIRRLPEDYTLVVVDYHV